MASRTLKGGLLAAAALTVATAALTQEGPENLLPDIFRDTPASTPEITPATPNQPRPPATDGETAGEGESGDVEGMLDESLGPVVAEPEQREDEDALASARTYKSFARVGPLSAARGGYGPATFAGTNGALFTAWMKRIDTPLASRWAHIVLRRALLSDAGSPRGVRSADWIAARVLLLTQMGEADGAMLMLQNLPLDGYTPRLYAVSSQAHLAAADVTGLCPLAPTAQAISNDPFWDLTSAICAGLEGDEDSAGQRITRLRRGDAVPPVELLLAERISALGGDGDRAANVDWTGVERLDARNFGMAAASGTAIPDELMAKAPTPITGWAFRAGKLPLEMRAEAGRRAAQAGIVSARELGAIESLRAARTDASEDIPQVARFLRTASTGRTSSERITAIRQLVDAGTQAGTRYASLIMTGIAAADIPPSADYVDDAPLLIESMLAAGRIEAALSWWPVLADADDAVKFRAWPMLALADTANRVPVTPGLARSAFKALSADDQSSARQTIRWMIAGLQGFGRANSREWASLAEDFGVPSRDDIWTEGMRRAGARGRKGEVAVLAALGLQGPWSKVRPQDLPPILAAYDKAGLTTEARLMAIEALSRAG